MQVRARDWRRIIIVWKVSDKALDSNVKVPSTHCVTRLEFLKILNVSQLDNQLSKVSSCSLFHAYCGI